MNIYVLNTSFNIVGVIDEYISVIWTTRYFTYGDFELCISANTSLINLLQEGYYLVREKDMNGNEYHNVMIISNREITTNIETGNNLIITGYCLKSILRRRVVASQTILNGTVENCIKQLITSNIINPSDSLRAISNFELGTDRINTSQSMQMQITGDNLSDAITEICTTYGYGYDIYLDNGDFVFYIYEGADRSYNQNVNPYVIFSTSYDNLISCDYKQNIDNFANVAVVAGEGEGTDRKKVTVGTATGINRYEIWVDARNNSSNDGEINQTDYLAMLTQQGIETLSEMTATTSFEGELGNNINFVFNQDYFLGDIVQVENDYGISATSRVLEVIESEDENGQNLITTFSEMEV